MAKPLRTTEEIVADTLTVLAGTVKAKTEDLGPVCPKCGGQRGWTGPHYQRGKKVTVKVPSKPNTFRKETVETVESLDYACNQCGYTRHEVCKDNE